MSPESNCHSNGLNSQIKNNSCTDYPDLKQLYFLVQKGNQFFSDNQLGDAEISYRRAITISPNIPDTYNNLGTVLVEQGKIEEACGCLEKALQLNPNYTSAYSNLLFTQHYKIGQTLPDLLKAHKVWAKTQLSIVPLSNSPLVRYTKLKASIRVGLVSPDLYYHPVGVFLLPWLECYDQQRFRLIGYTNTGRIDGMTKRLIISPDYQMKKQQNRFVMIVLIFS